MATSVSLGRVRQDCPVCSAPDLQYEFIIDGYPACGCQRCGLLFLNPQPGTEAPAVAVSTGEGASATANADVDQGAAESASTALARLLAYARLTSGRLLLVNATPQMHAEARARGFDVTAVSVRALEHGSWPEATGTFDACLFNRAVETAVDPLALLESVRRLLVPGGSIMVIAPTLDSRAARLFRSRWWDFRKENRFYFSADTLQSLVLRAGYGDPIIDRDTSLSSARQVRERLATLPRGGRYRLLRIGAAVAPGFVRRRALRFLYSRTILLARTRAHNTVPRLSVVMPVYNERSTFESVMDLVLAKRIDGVDIEIVIVESNSTDGTRDLVRKYERHPRVHVILEERAKGKGHAVRRGFAAATGDVILIQDADLEYDIDDYDALIEPILRYQQNFVIGSRHVHSRGAWKMREFSDAAGLAAFFNVGHLVFLWLFNAIYQQKLRDPFSMFKVFRRDCLYGLTFECDRFDFDFELAIKLLRKGYRPLELPVNYKARSFTEGKKVTVFRDPLTWVRALVKFRTSPLYRERQEGQDA